MSLKLHSHPFAAFCQKAIIAFYETGTPFEPVLVDLGDPTSRETFLKLWPMGKMPVLRDDARNHTIPEATIIIEYLARYYPSETKLIPADPDLAWQTRLADRFYDFYVSEPMQKIVTDNLRPEGKGDPHGVELARAQLETAYTLIDRDMAARTWAMGETFTLADCSAAPALFYAAKVAPFAAHANLARYFERLMARPSFARVVEEAKPYFHLFPAKTAG